MRVNTQPANSCRFVVPKLLCLNAVCIVCTVPSFCLFVVVVVSLLLFFFFLGLTLLYSQDETFASTVNFGLAWLMFNLGPNTNIDKHLVNRVSKSHEFDF